jgi:hypothetical protein
MAGQGAQIDAFELSMNRAAEKAAPAASGIFKTAMPSLPLAEVNFLMSTVTLFRKALMAFFTC